MDVIVSKTLSCSAHPDTVDPLSREAGVRNLKKLLEKIYRKAALKLVKRGVQGPPKPEIAEPVPDKQSGACRIAACPPSCGCPHLPER